MTHTESLQLLDLPPMLTDRWAAQLGEPQRHYHTLAHIEQMLADLPPGLASREIVAAIWLHDIVYDPQAADNEERSADQATIDLTGTGIDAGEVATLIRGTKHHGGGSAAQQLLDDIDLAILAADEAAYDRYTDAIRLEYAHVPADRFRAGRAAILRQFLEQPAIYRTAAFTGREAQARANLRREIAHLKGGPG